MIVYPLKYTCLGNLWTYHPSNVNLLHLSSPVSRVWDSCFLSVSSSQQSKIANWITHKSVSSGYVPPRKPHAARINKKEPGNTKKNKQEEKLAYLLSFTLFFPLTSKVTFAPGLVIWRHALVSTTMFHPSTPTSRDWTWPRLRKSTPD